ncbi:hypothetical protein F4804DRAFT_329025 [Jackrogersella minutella]|nr:hypothetical protein F4804DRAFT_329025 [Jackrogersella minutella]
MDSLQKAKNVLTGQTNSNQDTQNSGGKNTTKDSINSMSDQIAPSKDFSGSVDQKMSNAANNQDKQF